MVSGGGHTDLEEVVVGLLHQGGCRHESTAGVAVDSDAVDVHVGSLLGQLFDARLLVRQPVVSQVEVAVAVISLRATRRSATVTQLHHQEAQLRQLLPAMGGGEGVAHALHLGARIDLGDDGVFLGGVKVEGLPEVAVQIRDPVGGLEREGLGHDPACGIQPRQVRLLELHDLLPFGIAQARDGGHVHP